ncbi:MAG TPA: thiamine phosphate synthase [Proteobacteria bacterium]|nr:thiamine-phosphate synthase [bacterium BMS3Abin14]HDL52795.1 thiamine phosphate synthase [Pseudomonadota bacterium]
MPCTTPPPWALDRGLKLLRFERRTMDLSLYIVTDRSLSLGRTDEEVVRRAVSVGATVIQYRDKGADGGAMVRTGRELVRICRSGGIPLIVNDRLDVALACGAAGVHLGQDDMDPEDARKIAGPGFIIGVSITTRDEALRARDAGADYLAANGVFPTATKTDLGSPLGIEGVRALAEATDLPLVAIGGIDSFNAASIIRAGAAGVAVVSDVIHHDDIEGRCGILLSAVSKGRAS